MNKQNIVVTQHPLVNALVVASAPQDAHSKCPYRAEASEPSMFTHVQGQLSAHWVNWFMNKFGMTQQMATNIGTALYDHLVQEPRRVMDPLNGQPQAMLEGSCLVSMAFVMYYKHAHDVSYTEAFSVGYDLVALQASDPSFSYSIETLEQSPESFSRLA